MKRLLDIITALLIIFLLSPVLIWVALLVRTKLGSPILFCQTRPGMYGKSFRMYKFRSMTDTRDQAGKLKLDELRLTSFGRFLRSSSLDELPELWNVLKGNMSLVGPRPLLMEYLPLYNAEQIRRHEIRPGITGWAQVNGRNTLTWDERFKLDVWYVDNQSIWLDVKIILMTIKKVLIREGISADGHVTMEKFKGNSSV